ncbi:60s ribosomal protein l23a [Lynx pardinus]|uniref:60s ribosomal protein l23a n=1 Tax=Lynx pardinus TaxID=191816 RepID=A0A485MK69_LYNPA|nr:60s ribosomal protein l23a [Lynx pardinus]
MAPQVEKEAPLKTKKAMLKASSHKKRCAHHLHLGGPRPCVSEGTPYILERAPLRRNKLDHSVIRFLLTTISAMKKAEDSQKHQIKQAVKRLYDIDMAKVNTLIRPKGERKAYVRLAPDYDVLDVVHKIGII